MKEFIRVKSLIAVSFVTRNSLSKPIKRFMKKLTHIVKCLLETVVTRYISNKTTKFGP